MKTWSFSKYVGSGNDFILFDNRDCSFPAQPSLIQFLCHRQLGVGSDGVILLENSSRADFSFRIFNSDGSEAEMCGNGLRCFVKWLISLGYTSSAFQIETLQTILTARQKEKDIQIDMHLHDNFHFNTPFSYLNQILKIHSLNTGVPHAVIFFQDIAKVDLCHLGKLIRNHHLWQPHGTNVTIVQEISTTAICIRTYERGVEGETLACGTGAAAAALAFGAIKRSQGPIVVKTKSGEDLIVDYKNDLSSKKKNPFSQISLAGSATQVFQGEIVF